MEKFKYESPEFELELIDKDILTFSLEETYPEPNPDGEQEWEE